VLLGGDIRACNEVEYVNAVIIHLGGVCHFCSEETQTEVKTNIRETEKWGEKMARVKRNGEQSWAYGLTSHFYHRVMCKTNGSQSNSGLTVSITKSAYFSACEFPQVLCNFWLKKYCLQHASQHVLYYKLQWCSLTLHKNLLDKWCWTSDNQHFFHEYYCLCLFTCV